MCASAQAISRLEFFRLGYYGGRGARKVLELPTLAAAPQPTPKPGEKNLTEILVDALTGAIVSEEIETPETEAKEKQEKAGKKR